MTRNRGWRRHKNYTKALRKRRIDHNLYYGDFFWYDSLHQYSKNKIHCSCAMCSRKTRNKGKRRHLSGNYMPSIYYCWSDLRKIQSMEEKEKEFYAGLAEQADAIGLELIVFDVRVQLSYPAPTWGSGRCHPQLTPKSTLWIVGSSSHLLHHMGLNQVRQASDGLDVGAVPTSSTKLWQYNSMVESSAHIRVVIGSSPITVTMTK